MPGSLKLHSNWMSVQITKYLQLMQDPARSVEDLYKTVTEISS